MYHTIGAKYEETKDIHGSDLVLLIKKALREQLPKTYKVLARKETYAGGWSIHFTVKNTGIDYYKRTEFGSYETQEHKDLVAKVQKIVDQYNFDDSDIMTDYGHVRFYSHIKVEK